MEIEASKLLEAVDNITDTDKLDKITESLLQIIMEKAKENYKTKTLKISQRENLCLTDKTKRQTRIERKAWQYYIYIRCISIWHVIL